MFINSLAGKVNRDAQFGKDTDVSKHLLKKRIVKMEIVLFCISSRKNMLKLNICNQILENLITPKEKINQLKKKIPKL